MTNLKKLIEDREEEFVEKFINKANTKNRWLWSLKGYHPNEIESFNSETNHLIIKAIIEKIEKILADYQLSPEGRLRLISDLVEELKLDE